MANLTIESIGQIIQSGDTEKLFTSGVASPSSARIEQIGREQGMSSESLGAASGGQTFTQILGNSMEKVNVMQGQADHAVKELIAGRSKNIHETLLAVERADSSLKLMMQVRNKILDAYREIMRMQV